MGEEKEKERRGASTSGLTSAVHCGQRSVGPFGKLRGRDFFTVSELAELALLVAQGLSFLRKSTNLVQLGKS